jgi:hypothetical protein
MDACIHTQKISRDVVTPLKNAMEACENEKKETVLQVSKAISETCVYVCVCLYVCACMYANRASSQQSN